MDKTLYVGSYGHRYSDTLGSVAGFDRDAVASAIAEATEYEAKELASYCEHTGNPDGDDGCNANGDCPECEEYTGGDCNMCDPDIVTYGVWPVSRVSDLGGLRIAKCILSDLRESDVVHFGEGAY